MLRKIGLLTSLFIVLHALPIFPKANINVSFGPLFPSNQKMYIAKEFVIKNDGGFTPVDTLVHIRDYVNWMNGYTVSGKFFELTFLKLGINLKYERFFKRYFNSYFFEAEGRLDSIPVNMNLIFYQAGFSSSFEIARNVIVEPEINLLYAESYAKHYTETWENGYGYGPYITASIGKMGLFTGLKLLYLKSDNVIVGSSFNLSFYSEINDLTINPFFQAKLYKRLNGYLGLNYSLITNAINPKLGVNFALF